MSQLTVRGKKGNYILVNTYPEWDKGTQRVQDKEYIVFKSESLSEIEAYISLNQKDVILEIPYTKEGV